MRTYSLALDLSIESVEKITLLQEELAPWFEQFGIRPSWVHADSIRLGLKSLDGVDDELLNAVSATVSGVTAKLVPFRISVREVHCLPEDNPRLVFAQIDNGSVLVDGLRKVIEAHLEKLGIPKDDRPYQPMVLIGRLPSPRQAIALPQTEIGDFNFGDSSVPHICLLRHELLKRKSRTSVIRRFPLGTDPQ